VQARQHHFPQGLPAGRPEDRRGLLDFLLEVFQDGLDGAHHEWQADEDERDDDAGRRECDLDAEDTQRPAQPAVGSVDRGQGDPRHRGGQGERQVDRRVDEAPPREGIAHEDPRQQCSDHRVHEGRAQRGEERQAQGGEDARGGDFQPEPAKSQLGGLPQGRRQRQQHDQAEVGDREAEGQAEARQAALVVARHAVGRIKAHGGEGVVVGHAHWIFPAG